MRLVTLVIALLALLHQRGAAQDRPALNLNTHSRVTIDAPAAAIWPHIVEPRAWKQGLELRRHGSPSGLGETFAAFAPGDPESIAFFVENVELLPNARRTIKLHTPDGALIGFATWTLVETGGHTVVGYDVYSETLLSDEQRRALTREALAEQEKASSASSQERFDAELRALKRLVETGRSR